MKKKWLMLIGLVFSIFLFYIPIVFADDNYEDNDIPANAAEIIKGDFLNLTWLDDDWYKVYVYENYILEVTIRFNNSEANLQLVLFNSTVFELNNSQTTNDIESTSIVASKTGFYLIYVTSFSGSTQYDMEVNVYLPSSNGAEENFFQKYEGEIISFFIGFSAAILLVIVIKLVKRNK
ncbi:MAG: hypothetical protein ACFFEY_20220 [Candidatus Thorarchaeota archaeon]